MSRKSESNQGVAEADKATSITVAPYFKTQFTPENTKILTKEVQQKFLNAAKNIANALGINITLIRDNLGGYVHEEDGSQVRELSYTIEFDETDKTTAQLFSSLLSDIGHQVQESVIVASYVEDSVTSYDGIEAFIECDTSDRHAIADILEKNGIHDYTINEKGVQLLWFGNKESIDKLTGKKENLTQEEQQAIDEYHTFVENSTKAATDLKGTLTKKKIQSDLLYPADREQLYKNTLKELEDEQTSSEISPERQGEEHRVGLSMESNGRSRNSREGYQRQFSDLINEALRNLQAFREGQEGVDLTNQWQQGEEEHQLNVPLTPNQLARSQLDKDLSQYNSMKMSYPDILMQ